MKKLFIILLVIALSGSIACSKSKISNSNNSDSSEIVTGVSTIPNPGNEETTNDPDISKIDSQAGDSKSASNTFSNKNSSGVVSKQPTPTITPVPTISVLIPEGFTASQIGDRLEAKGVCKKVDFLNTINSYDFSYYSLVNKISINPNRCFKLEGYLFPETYLFYLNMKPQDVIGKMLRQSEEKIGSKYSYPDMSTDDIITLASIIQKESASLEQMKNVSSVFHNRLKQGMRLQADPTIYYVEQFIKPNISGDINRYNSYYNTYKCNALPSGAICNPGLLALQAAVSPSNTTFIYFVTDTAGKYYYANTWEEHVQNCVTAGVIPQTSESVG